MHSLFDIAGGKASADSMWCAIQYWCNHSIVYARRLMYNYCMLGSPIELRSCSLIQA
jgi:hypothetical protein